VTTIAGTVLTISQVPLGDVLAADATAGDTTITVDDAADFAEGGGTILIGGQLDDYTSVDDETGVMTLVDALFNNASAGDRVDLADPDGSGAVEWQALVAPAGTVDVDEAVQATISYALIPLLPEGIRDPGTGESVTLTKDGSEWQVTNVHGQQPNLNGDNLTGGAVIVGNTSGAAHATAITSTNGSATGSTASADYAVQIGAGGNVSAVDGVGIGDGVTVSAQAGIGIGVGATVSGFAGIGIGQAPTASGAQSTAVGNEPEASGAYSGAIGPSVTATADGAWGIGADSGGASPTPSGVNDFIIGTSNHHVSIPGDFAVHGATPVAQSATPTTLADVIAILQAHGFCA